MGITHHSNYIRWMEEARTASSSHAFLGRDGRPVRMKQDYPDLYNALTRAASPRS